jgi:hypothetical protein
MTKEEVKKLVVNDGHNLRFNLYSNAFEKDLRQYIYIPTLNWDTGEKEDNLDKLITNYVVNCINSFLELNKSEFLGKLKDEIFRLFNIYIEATSYGQVPDELISQYGTTEANRIFFNGQTKESVYSTCNFHEVFYVQDSGPELRFSIYIKIDWEMEHGLTIFFENGQFVNIE